MPPQELKDVQLGDTLWEAVEEMVGTVLELTAAERRKANLAEVPFLNNSPERPILSDLLVHV
jgi:hypothetical protein